MDIISAGPVRVSRIPSIKRDAVIAMTDETDAQRVR
jgi:hypothetical protein